MLHHNNPTNVVIPKFDPNDDNYINNYVDEEVDNQQLNEIEQTKQKLTNKIQTNLINRLVSRREEESALTFFTWDDDTLNNISEVKKITIKRAIAEIITGILRNNEGVVNCNNNILRWKIDKKRHWFRYAIDVKQLKEMLLQTYAIDKSLIDKLSIDIILRICREEILKSESYGNEYAIHDETEMSLNKDGNLIADPFTYGQGLIDQIDAEITFTFSHEVIKPRKDFELNSLLTTLSVDFADKWLNIDGHRKFVKVKIYRCRPNYKKIREILLEKFKGRQYLTTTFNTLYTDEVIARILGQQVLSLGGKHGYNIAIDV